MMMTIAYILGFCCIAITCIGTWEYIMEDKKFITAMCFVLAIASILTSFEYVHDDTKREINAKYRAVIEQKDAEIAALKTEFVEENYYIGAEISEQNELEDGTYEVDFVVINTNGMTYKWISDYEYPEDAPYMLTMDSNKTTDLLDDKILVVWMDMN